MEHAIAYQDSDVLPPHWDRVILSSMLEETSTEGSSEEDLADSGDDTESTEEKDHLVAELYKGQTDSQLSPFIYFLKINCISFFY